MHNESIPLIDLRRFDAGSIERERFLRKLRYAAREVGFFHLAGHGMETAFFALGQRGDVLEPLYKDDPHTLVKLIRYPGRDQTSSDQGVGAHKDSDLLPLLLQDERGGLQVEREQCGGRR
jgi:isopenicillin N synthase-like dioxygenase